MFGKGDKFFADRGLTPFIGEGQVKISVEIHAFYRKCMDPTGLNFMGHGDGGEDGNPHLVQYPLDDRY